MLRRNRPYYFYPILFIYLYIFHPFIPIVDLCYASEYHIFKVGLLQWNKYLYHTPFVPNYSSLLLYPKSNFFNFDQCFTLTSTSSNKCIIETYFIEKL
jgi:hypothetical protein